MFLHVTLSCARILSSCLCVFITPGKFQHFDFGTKENLKRYNQTQPPVYNLANVVAPVGLLWAVNDFLADPRVACCLPLFGVHWLLCWLMGLTELVIIITFFFLFSQ